ncbi:hypothetical protein Tco_0687463 [Tanacetum coccineum]
MGERKDHVCSLSIKLETRENRNLGGKRQLTGIKPKPYVFNAEGEKLLYRRNAKQTSKAPNATDGHVIKNRIKLAPLQTQERDRAHLHHVLSQLLSPSSGRQVRGRPGCGGRESGRARDDGDEDDGVQQPEEDGDKDDCAIHEEQGADEVDEEVKSL